ncbi:Hypothetical protein SMAX5B_017338 [Scophthalmus maximus]|uniref:Uncharacterized protein n=1 Tax=Scophthalmus maximus TaxID=52904 RepID=A0A2U9CQA5_SCOMX|nr:Hypothetical protein SMAX5B_017338 [Scophthalmus maximus]
MKEKHPLPADDKRFATLDPEEDDGHILGLFTFSFFVHRFPLFFKIMPNIHLCFILGYL